MNRADYPELFQISDLASLRAQGAYTRAVRLKLVFIVLTAFAASIAFGGIAGRISAILTTIFLSLSIVFSFIIRKNKWEHIWFNTRAIAESVKALTWRYMMGARPFLIDKPVKEAEKDFITQLNTIKGALPETTGYLTGLRVKGSKEISREMRRIRGLSAEKRKKIYLESRVKDQLSWYDSKSHDNTYRERFWFWAVLGVQVFAVSVAIAISVLPGWPYNPVGPLATVAASFVAWNQIKRHKELFQSYSMAARELTALEAIASSITDEKGLASFVTDTEYMISREHTMWHVRSTSSEGEPVVTEPKNGKEENLHQL